MKTNKDNVHPYIPNMAPEVQKEMLQDIGVKTIDELYSDIPEEIRFRGKMNLPKPCVSELELKQHVERILAKNKSCNDCISFLGGGSYHHYVPAICDEVNRRSEFLTAYAGEPYEDHGRFQSLFEYESLMAEMLDFDVVNVPTYDWTQAASTALRMSGRITKRTEVLIADTVSPDRLSAMRNYCTPSMKITMVGHCPKTGQIDLEDLKSKMNKNVAAIYFENPAYLGFIQEMGGKVADIMHANGSLMIVGVDPISLGVIKPPSQYGADMACGDIQGLGVHMYYGGALGGFLSSRDEEKIVMEYPSRLFGITKSEKGEWAFDDVAYDRTSFAQREKGKEFIGTAAALWGITAGVYLALMGPRGMQELDKHILQKSQYAMKRLSRIKGVKAPKFASACFKEFVVDFSGTGKTVAYINKELLKSGIFGGKDLSGEFADLKDCALYCVTEMVSQADIDRLVAELSRIIRK